jgi:putative Holliday junction resolvase
MRYIGIDLGTRRIGLAFGDELGVATPLPALTSADAGERRLALLKVIGERRADEIVIGHPLNMDDSEGPKAKEAEGFAAQLSAELGKPVHLVDERLAAGLSLHDHTVRFPVNKLLMGHDFQLRKLVLTLNRVK